MFERRTSFLVCFLSGLALLLGDAGSLAAQDEPQPDDPAGESKPQDPAFPPAMTDNLTKQLIKQEDGQGHGLVLYTPKSWTRQAPKAETDDWLAEFTITEEGQDPLKLYVLCYKNETANIGGGVQANIERWTNEFAKQDREKKITTGQRTITYPDATEHAQEEERKYVLVDLKGTRTSGGANAAENSRMLAAILGIQWQKAQDDETQSAVFFLKMAGPADTLTGKVEEDFRRAFGALHKDNENELKESAATETTAN